MTVKELINILSTMPQDALVVSEGYEYGYDSNGNRTYLHDLESGNTIEFEYRDDILEYIYHGNGYNSYIAREFCIYDVFGNPIHYRGHPVDQSSAPT